MNPTEHSVSVVIPTYAGEDYLTEVVTELETWTRPAVTADGRGYRITEVLLVHDDGPDRTHEVMRELAGRFPWVRTLWLSRNYGQHAATLAGIAESTGDWVVTMDDDGQHDPRYIGDMIDAAVREQAKVVYAAPVNPPHHTWFRNTSSRWAKRVINVLSGSGDATQFQSFRLILGDVGRSFARSVNAGVYLDVGLAWVVGRAATAPVELRPEPDHRTSSYSVSRLFGHFLRMVLSGGTRGLRAVSLLGVLFALGGTVLAVVIIVRQLTDPVQVQGWTSTIVVLLVVAGAVLLALGVIAEYIGVAVTGALGRPLYLLTEDPADGPLGRDQRGSSKTE